MDGWRHLDPPAPHASQGEVFSCPPALVLHWRYPTKLPTHSLPQTLHGLYIHSCFCYICFLHQGILNINSGASWIAVLLPITAGLLPCCSYYLHHPNHSILNTSPEPPPPSLVQEQPPVTPNPWFNCDWSLHQLQFLMLLLKCASYRPLCKGEGRWFILFFSTLMIRSNDPFALPLYFAPLVPRAAVPQSNCTR